MFYTVKMPAIIRKLRADYMWKINTDEKVLFLTFDDGPNLTATPFVLDELKKYDAKATFFCIGKNVEQHKELYQRIIAEGHVTGNHTYDHLNGYKTSLQQYLENVGAAAKLIQSNLFRPPYGRIKRKQAKTLQKDHLFNVIMWHVLSGDFDTTIDGEKCFTNVLRTAEPGSIVVFHDSDKAFARLQYALPRVLEHFKNEKYSFGSLTTNVIKTSMQY